MPAATKGTRAAWVRVVDLPNYLCCVEAGASSEQEDDLEAGAASTSDGNSMLKTLHVGIFMII